MFNYPNNYQYQYSYPYQKQTAVPQYSQPVQALSAVPQQNGGGMLWVNGEQEAYGFMMAPNSAVALWDSSRPVIYLKQTDASGRPTLKTYDLIERTEPLASPSVPSQAPTMDYVTREEFTRLEELVASLKKEDASDE